MSVEIAWKQNILVTDSYLLKLLLVVFGFGLQAFICDFSRQNICSAYVMKRKEEIVMFQNFHKTVKTKWPNWLLYTIRGQILWQT